jgi:head-tail adaptor
MAREIVHPRLLGVLRPVDEALMPDTCEILSTTAAADSSGGYPATEGVSATIVGDLSSDLSGEEQVIADRLEWAAAYRLRLPLGTAITPSTRVRVNSTRTFEVGAVLQDGLYATAMMAICREQG